MSAKFLIIIGSLILGLLGLAHLIFTLYSDKFHAHDPSVTTAMQQTSPKLTKGTTMWRAWMGFNCSHSLGVLWLPLIYIPLATAHMEILQQSLWLTLLLPLMAFSYVVMAKRYWFSAPLIGSSMALICFSIAFYLLHLN